MKTAKARNQKPEADRHRRGETDQRLKLSTQGLEKSGSVEVVFRDVTRSYCTLTVETIVRNKGPSVKAKQFGEGLAL